MWGDASRARAGFVPETRRSANGDFYTHRTGKCTKASRALQSACSSYMYVTALRQSLKPRMLEPRIRDSGGQPAVQFLRASWAEASTETPIAGRLPIAHLREDRHSTLHERSWSRVCTGTAPVSMPGRLQPRRPHFHSAG